ncbi:MAG: oligosaccharide flippase family protein, partial [Eubacteriaceae bacterium]
MLTQIKAGVLLSYLTLFLGNIISFLYTPFMLRLMGQSEYGLYTLSTSIIGCLGIMEFGLGNALIRNVAEYRALNDRESQYRLYGMYFIIYLLIAILVTIAGSYLVLNIGAFFARTLSQDEIMKAKIIMSLMVLNLALSLPFSVFSSAILAYERFVFSKTIQLLYTLLNPMIMIPLLLMGYRSVEMAIVGTCFAILSIVVNTYYCFKVLKIKLYFAKFDRVILKKNMTYAFSVFLAIIFDKVFWSSNPFVLGLTSGTISVAIYSIGASFSTYYMSLGGAITGLFL